VPRRKQRRTERALGIASDECNLAMIRDEHYKYVQEMLSWRMSHQNRGFTDYWRRYGSPEPARRYPVSPSHR